MKLCSTNGELRLINEIAWRHVCVSTSPHRRHKTSRFGAHSFAMVTSLIDCPLQLNQIKFDCVKESQFGETEYLFRHIQQKIC